MAKAKRVLEKEAVYDLTAGDGGPLLEVEDLHVEFRTREGIARAVNGVSYSVRAGETLAVLGESGSGKSVTAQAIMGILDTPPGYVTAGEVRFRGRNILTEPEQVRRKLRGAEMAMIFQDALSALNPVFSVGWQIGEMFRVHQGTSRKEAKKQAIELLDRVRIPSAAERVNDYPHQFSGGMRQRVMIAMSIALNPKLLIADEPTTALDVTVQAQVMDLLAELQRDLGMGMILITHDLGVVADVADKCAVMYAGRIVEQAEVNQLYSNPAHPYTEALLSSIPRVDLKGHDMAVIQGLPPTLTRLPSGCSFHPRCGRVRERCSAEEPPLYAVPGERGSACHYWEEVLDGSRGDGEDPPQR